MAVPVIAGAAILATAGALIALQKPLEGLRLDDLTLNTSDYGLSLNYGAGTPRFDGLACIFAEKLKEVKRRRKTKGGKFNDYTYYGTWADVLCDLQIDRVLQIWFDRNLVYDVEHAGPVSPFELEAGPGGLIGSLFDQLGLGGGIENFMTIYLGTEDQEPDPRMAATLDAIHGEGSTSAFRGVAYIVFKDVPLEKLGNRRPQVSVRVATAATALFPFDERTAGYRSSVWTSFSADFTKGYWTQLDADDPSIRYLEIWDLRARAPMVMVSRTDIAPFTAIGVDTLARIYLPSDDRNALKVLDPDGAALLKTVGPPDITWGANYLDFPALGDVYAFGDTVYATSWSINNHGWSYVYPADRATLLEARDDGDAFQWKHFFADGYGGVWALGGGGALAGDELIIRQLKPGVDQPGTVGVARLTMPVSNGGAITVVAGFHCHQAPDDHIIVKFGNGTGVVVRLDWETLSIQDQLIDVTAAFDDTAASATPPGARTLWLGGLEWDFVAMEVVRDVDAVDYDPSFFSDQTTFLVPSLKALMRVSGTEDIQFLYLERATGDGVTLRSIVEDVSLRCGLDVDEDIDASDLTQTVRAYAWTQGTGKAILEPLLEAFDSEARLHDFKIQFLRRGAAVLGTIAVSEFVAGGDRYEVPSELDTDLPLKVNFTFADMARDQQPNTAISQRNSASTDSRRELSLDCKTLGLTAEEGRQVADGYRRREWLKAQTVKTPLPRTWLRLECGDAWNLQLDDVTRAFKLAKLEIGANGVLQTEWQRYNARIHTPTALPGGDADGMLPTEVPVFGYTKGIALDIPLTQDGHDSVTPFLYLAGAPYSDTPWPGAIFYRSPDGEAYDEELGAVAAAERATIGATLSALPDADPHVWDRGSSVTVQMFDGELTSATEAECASGANLAAIGRHGRWEIVNFKTPTLIAPGKYMVSGFLRGRRGSEWACGLHEAGDQFVLLAGLPRAEMGADDVGDDVYVRPTTNGGSSSGFPQLLDPYAAAALKPYAPAHLVVVDDGGDLVGTWRRRTRVGATALNGVSPPLGEGSERYRVYILDADGDELRHYDVTDETATYSAADQVTDGGLGVTWRVVQRGAAVDGYVTDAAI